MITGQHVGHGHARTLKAVAILQTALWALVFVPAVLFAFLGQMIFEPGGRITLGFYFAYAAIVSFPVLIAVSIPLALSRVRKKDYKRAVLVNLLPTLSIAVFFATAYLDGRN